MLSQQTCMYILLMCKALQVGQKIHLLHCAACRKKAEMLHGSLQEKQCTTNGRPRDAWAPGIYGTGTIILGARDRKCTS